jgi:hypothetical protein
MAENPNQCVDCDDDAGTGQCITCKRPLCDVCGPLCIDCDPQFDEDDDDFVDEDDEDDLDDDEGDDDAA